MQVFFHDGQLAATPLRIDEGLDFIGVALFGLRKGIEPLTKRFPLFKG